MRHSISILCAVSLLTSCNCNFRMVTSIEKDGAITRSFICPADSALLCGTQASDINESILPIKITDDWEVSWNTVNDPEHHSWPMTPEEYNSCKDTVLLTVKRRFDSAEDMSDKFQFDIIPVKPYSKLEKKFKWFYTEFVYSETFPKPDFTIPLSEYLSDEEALFWFTGKPENTVNRSGSLVFEDLCNIAPRINEWLAANYLAEVSQYIANHYDEVPDAPISREEFVNSVDTFVKQCSSEAGDSSIYDSSWLEMSFLRHYGSNAFMKCIKDMTEPLPSEIWSAYMNFSFCYSTVMPGNPKPSSMCSVNGKVQSCTLNLGMIYPEDYTLVFRSQVFNVWAWLSCAFLAFFISSGIHRRHINTAGCRPQGSGTHHRKSPDVPDA